MSWLSLLFFPALLNAQVPVPAGPAGTWDAPSLDRLFDGRGGFPTLAGPAVRSSGRPVLRLEDEKLPPAPRYALDLGLVPERLRLTVPGFEQLYHRNQEETPGWVSRINELVRQGNAERTFGKIPEWKYDGRPNEPPFVCLSYAAATVNDWWRLQLGMEPLPAQRSGSTGRVEPGTSPDMFELEYIQRSGQGWANFVVPPAFIQKDPVRQTAFPYEPRGYAELLVESRPYEVKDPITGATYRYEPAMSAMEGRWVQLFGNHPLHSNTPADHAQQLAQAIDKWGIAYVQLEHSDKPRLPGAHTVAVIGYFCMEGSDRFVECSANRRDDDWGRNAYFMVHDSFGDNPASTIRHAQGGAAYRAVRIESVDQAIVFPHSLDIVAAPDGPGVWKLAILNKGGRPVPAFFAAATDASGAQVAVTRHADGGYRLSGKPGEVRVYVEARYYYEADGKGRVFQLRLDPGRPVAGVETVRTPPTRSSEPSLQQP